MSFSLWSTTLLQYVLQQYHVAAKLLPVIAWGTAYNPYGVAVYWGTAYASSLSCRINANNIKSCFLCSHDPIWLDLYSWPLWEHRVSAMAYHLRRILYSYALHIAISDQSLACYFKRRTYSLECFINLP